MRTLIAFLAGLGIGFLIGRKLRVKSEISGIGAGGRGRYGVPKTEAERLETHKRLYGTETLPPRGTGIKRRGLG